MSAFSDYMETAIANYIRGTAMPAAPAAVYVSLHAGSPTDTGTGGSEVTTSIRTAGRPAVTFGAPNDGQISNSAVVDFGSAQNAANGVTHFGVWTAASGGNLLMYGALSSGGGDIKLGAAVSFAAGSLVLGVA